MHPTYIKGWPRGLNISPVIWQSYINAILDCLQSRKYCEAIMDNLLLFTPNENISFCQVRRPIKGTMQEWIENIPKEMPIFQDRTAVYW